MKGDYEFGYNYVFKQDTNYLGSKGETSLWFNKESEFNDDERLTIEMEIMAGGSVQQCTVVELPKDEAIKLRDILNKLYKDK